MAAILASVVAALVLATLIAGQVGRAGFPLPPEDQRIGCVDGLRGYLALCVMAHHFIIWLQITRLGGRWEPTPVHFFNQLGSGGVALFFMATGLVFYPRVLAGFRANAWVAIYTKRIFRIFPLVIVSVAMITGIIAWRTGRGLDSDFPAAAAAWVVSWGTPPLLGYPDSGRLNSHVLWSLWYEWMFYLFVLPLCALAMTLIRGRLPSWLLPFALLIATLTASVLNLPGSMVPYLPLFALGMIAYEAQRRPWIVRVLRTPAMSVVAAASLGLGMIFAKTPYTFAMPLFGVFFICVACGNSLGGVLRTKGALVLGECSFSIYILHGIVLSLVFVDAGALLAPLATEMVPVVLPLVAIVIALATPITYLLVERPANRAGALLAARWTRRRMRATVSEAG